MSPITTIRALVRRSVRRRFHRPTRIGYNAATSSTTITQTYLGLSLMGLGWYLKHSKKRSLLYATDVRSGKTVKVNVMRGTTVLAETTVAN